MNIELPPMPQLDNALPYSAFGYLQNIPAIYFMFDFDNLYYIGRTMDLRKRIGGHIHKDRFESISNLWIGWIEVPEGSRKLIPLELENIAAHMPLWNKQGKPND